MKPAVSLLTVVLAFFDSSCSMAFGATKEGGGSFGVNERKPVRGKTPEKAPLKPFGMSVSWKGYGSDVVGKRNDAGPNGEADGLFRLTISTGGKPRRLVHISLTTTPWSHWDTTPNQYWILGVVRNGRRLNPTDKRISDLIEGEATYDLFANDAGNFTAGKTFKIEARFADGATLSKQIRLK